MDVCSGYLMVGMETGNQNRLRKSRKPGHPVCSMMTNETDSLYKEFMAKQWTEKEIMIDS